jgi:hypothetical protein
MGWMPLAAVVVVLSLTVGAAEAVTLYPYAAPLPLENADGFPLLFSTLLYVNGAGFCRVPLYVGETPRDAATAFCASLNASYPSADDDCVGVVLPFLLDKLLLVADRARTHAVMFVGDEGASVAAGGVLGILARAGGRSGDCRVCCWSHGVDACAMAAVCCCDTLLGAVETLSTHVGADTASALLLSLNKRLSSVEAALSSRPQEATSATTASVAVGPDAATSVDVDAAFRPDACAPLYSRYSRSALDGAESPSGSTEGPAMLRTLRHRDDFPTLLNEMHLTGAGACDDRLRCCVTWWSLLLVTIDV